MPFRLADDELAYATTPFLIEHLLDRGYDRVLFFKRESLVTGGHAASLELLEDAAIVLTPHLLTPLAGEESERELDVLLAGTYNVGFLGIAESPAARAMLRWWQERLREHCRHDVMGGLHFEQRWVDLVPGMFDGVRVTRDPGASIGHWSLPERRVEIDGEDVRVDGRPCRLARFSGYDLDHPEAATRYHDRLASPTRAGTPRRSSAATANWCSRRATPRRARCRTRSPPSTTASRCPRSPVRCMRGSARAAPRSATRSRPPGPGASGPG